MNIFRIWSHQSVLICLHLCFNSRNSVFATWSVVSFRTIWIGQVVVRDVRTHFQKELCKNIQAIRHYRACKMAKNGQDGSKTSKMTVFGHFAGSVASYCLYIFAWFNMKNYSSHLRLRFGWFRLSWKKSQTKLQKMGFCCSHTIDGISNHCDTIKFCKYLWGLLNLFPTFYSAEVMSQSLCILQKSACSTENTLRQTFWWVSVDVGLRTAIGWGPKSRKRWRDGTG